MICSFHIHSTHVSMAISRQTRAGRVVGWYSAMCAVVESMCVLWCIKTHRLYIVALRLGHPDDLWMQVVLDPVYCIFSFPLARRCLTCPRQNTTNAWGAFVRVVNIRVFRTRGPVSLLVLKTVFNCSSAMKRNVYYPVIHTICTVVISVVPQYVTCVCRSSTSLRSTSSALGSDVPSGLYVGRNHSYLHSHLYFCLFLFLFLFAFAFNIFFFFFHLCLCLFFAFCLHCLFTS